MTEIERPISTVIIQRESPIGKLLWHRSEGVIINGTLLRTTTLPAEMGLGHLLDYTNQLLFFVVFKSHAKRQTDSFSNSPGTTFLICTLSGFITILIPILIRRIGLSTRVSKQGLSSRFIPFHRYERVCLFENILCVEAVQYRPIWDYGG